MSSFKCPKCRKTTGGNEVFCIECGEPLNITCPECGKIWRYMFDYRFCPDCGHNIKNEEMPHEEEHHKKKSQSHTVA
jgi:hypothetical protein